MDIKLATLTADVVLNHDRFMRGIMAVEGRLASLGRTLNFYSAGLAGIVAGQALSQGFTGMIGQAIDLESRLSQVRKTTGLFGSKLDELRTKLTDLSIAFGGFRLSEMFDIATMGGRLGVAADKIVEFTRDIAMIRVALDDIPAQEAATSIARILNEFKIGSDYAINFASALNKLDDSSTATGRDILDITQRIAGSAAVLGIGPQKIMALATALKDAGVMNEVAGTAMSQVFSRLATDTQKFALVANVELGRFARVLRSDPIAALQLFLRGLSRLDKVTQFQALEQLGLDGYRVQSTLLQLNSVIYKLPGYIRTAGEEWRTLNSILRENEVAGNTTAAQLERFQNAFAKITMQVGDWVLPLVRTLADSFVHLSEDVHAFLDRNKEAIEGFARKVDFAFERVGLFISQFRTFVGLGKEMALEKFEQFIEVANRIGQALWKNLVWAGKTGVTVLTNLLKGIATYLQDLFTQVAAHLSVRLTNALNEAIISYTGNPIARRVAQLLDRIIPGTLQTFDDAARDARKARGAYNEPPEIKPDNTPIQKPAIMAGVQPMPGVNVPGLVQNLPRRPGVQQHQRQLDAAQADWSKQQEARRKAFQPKPLAPPTNRFATMTPQERDRARNQNVRHRKEAQRKLERTQKKAREAIQTPGGRKREAAPSTVGLAPTIFSGLAGAPIVNPIAQSQAFLSSYEGQIFLQQSQMQQLEFERRKIAEGEQEARRRKAEQRRFGPKPKAPVIGGREKSPNPPPKPAPNGGTPVAMGWRGALTANLIGAVGPTQSGQTAPDAAGEASQQRPQHATKVRGNPTVNRRVAPTPAAIPLLPPALTAPLAQTQAANTQATLALAGAVGSLAQSLQQQRMVLGQVIKDATARARSAQRRGT